MVSQHDGTEELPERQHIFIIFSDNAFITIIPNLFEIKLWDYKNARSNVGGWYALLYILPSKR